MSRCPVVPTLVLALCLPLTPTAAQDEDVGRSDSSLLNATVTTARPEVGAFGFCTGTLILPQYVITASHCFGHFSTIFPASTRPSFSIDQADGERTSYPVERVFSFGYPIGSYDVALVRLTQPVPADVATPARIFGGTPATNSQVTVMGYGCTAPGGRSDGRKRVRVTRMVVDGNSSWTTRNTQCRGDSGGPIFAGTGDRAPIFGVSAQYVGAPPNQTDIYGQLPRLRSEIFAIALAWQARGHEDISNVDWCTGDTERSYNADVNADRQLDAICHDERSGRIEVAVGNRRVIKPAFTYPTVFCRGENEELHLGDFNADRRTDLLCVNRANGDRTVLFATSEATYSASNAYRGRVGFCTHDGSEIHTGDFNGDGRTDMLCHDRNNGRKWIDYASADSRSLFGGADWSTDTNWCSHRGAQLHVADFNRDRHSDLLCHTRPNGAIDLKLWKAGTVFSQYMDFQQTEAGFCTDSEDTLRTWDLVGNGRAGLVCIDNNGDGDGESIASHSDETPFIISPVGQLRHWTRGSFGARAVRQWYITQTGVANQPDQRARRRDRGE